MKRKKIIVMILVFVMMTINFITQSFAVYITKGTSFSNSNGDKIYVFNDSINNKVFESNMTESMLVKTFTGQWYPTFTGYSDTDFQANKSDIDKKTGWFLGLIKAIYYDKGCNLMKYPNDNSRITDECNVVDK